MRYFLSSFRFCFTFFYYEAGGTSFLNNNGDVTKYQLILVYNKNKICINEQLFFLHVSSLLVFIFLERI